MWVRNGQNIRGLLIHYRETYLRDDGYDNDLLLLQYSMMKIDPEVFTITLLQRFGMLLESNAQEQTAANPGKWSLLDHVDRDQGLSTGVVIQLCTMLEELLGLMIVLLTEVAGLNNLSDRLLIRRALIHLLCFAPLPWSEIVRAVPERMCENIDFIRILRDVADLHYPQGKTETGYYHLRQEFYNEINPYYYHYTRNQQQQASEILMKKRDTRVVSPSPVRLPPAPHPFARLHDILQSPFVIDLVYFALWKAVELDVKQKTGDASDPQFIPTVDGMLELALQLALVALVNAPKPSAARVVAAQHPTLPQEENLLGLLHTLKANKSKSAFSARIDLILEIVEQHQPGARRLSARSANGVQTVSNALADEARKSKNKKRQADIMAQFAKNQQAALDAFDDDEEDMEEDSFYGNCIVCQEECRASRPSGVLAYIQPSKTVRNLVVQKDWYEEILRTPTNLDQPIKGERYGSGLTGEPTETDAYPIKHQRFGLHASSCGHMMHEACLQGFCKNTRARQLSQGQRNHPENSWRGEFLCPLCKSLSNMLLPLDPPLLERPVPNEAPILRPNLSNAIRQVSDESLKHTNETRQAFRRQHANAGQIIPCFATNDRTAIKFTPGDDDLQQRCRFQMLKRFMDITIPISDQTAFMQKRLEDCGIYLPQDLLAYSIGCVEIASRGQPSGSQQEFTTEATERMIYGVTVLLREKMVFQGFPLGDETIGRIGIFTRLLPDWFRPRPLQVPLLARDPLTIVAEAAITCQHALSPVIVLCYHVELCRAMLAVTFWARLCSGNTQNPAWATKPTNEDDFTTAQTIFPEAKSLLLNFYRQTPQLYHEALSALASVPESHIAKFLYSFTLPFLRRCTILTQALKHSNPESNRPVAGPGRDEYTRYLNAFSILPPGRSLFQSTNAAVAAARLNGTEQLSGIIGGWLKQWIANKQQLPVLEYPGVYDLYRLPANLTDVFRIGLNRKCKACDTEPSHPALCLFCGQFLCLGTDCCAEGELGECNIHRME
jgi:E3 ubiquitin-protein ligase UBR1